MEETKKTVPNIPEHHVQKELCTTRPHYRQGRKLTAVKVYTINNESQHILFYGVPALNLSKELKTLCLKYGELHSFETVSKYDLEEFTECYHANYKRIQSARIAKRFLDDKPFYGGVLHVCYAPEYETLNELRKKLEQREKDVKSRIQPGPTQLEYINSEKTENITRDRKRKNPALPITDKRLKNEDRDSVWKDIPKELDPRLQDPFLNFNSVGLKKHFQLPNTSTEYGPKLNNYDFTIPSTSKSEPIVKKTLLPTPVMKVLPKENIKRIVFRKKNVNNK